VDPLTHALSSLALQRVFWPKAPKIAFASVVIAGVVADLDWFTASLGPSPYLRWHRTASHSLLAAFVAAAVGIVVSFLVATFVAGRGADGVGEDRRSYAKREGRRFFTRLYLFALLSALLHLTLDLFQADGASLLWPFSSRRWALDLLANLDPWLIAVLILAILLPELFRLVGSEIGARDKRPRGRNGAVAGFVVILLYLALRANCHAAATGSLDAHTIAGETPRRVAAFPDSTSPFLWHSVVETESAIHLADLRAIGEPSFASMPVGVHKPEPSAILDAARTSQAAVIFLRFARFPKATVVKETEGYSVEIQDFKDQATGEKTRAVMVDVNLDKSGAVVSSELQWRERARH
jgi:inner membrane protein